MPEETPVTLNHFTQFLFQNSYYSLSASDRKELNRQWLSSLQDACPHTSVYQVYPAHANLDLLVWSAIPVMGPQTAAIFFERFARATNPFRGMLQPIQTFWGFTKPSQYTKTRSTQEIDPFDANRKPYLILYPFSKTAEWYLMSREARQGMMNEHIRIGKQYPEIQQLLVYSFGLQDQEFVVVYETDDPSQFSNLVYELRDSEARRFTLRDTPLITALYHPADETLALWE